MIASAPAQFAPLLPLAPLARPIGEIFRGLLLRWFVLLLLTERANA
jgi:hypothetical protein